MGEKPENITSYKDKSAEQLDLLYIKGAENLVVFKEKSELPNYLNEYDEKMNDVTEKLQNSKEREELYKERLKSQEERLKKIENILIRNIQDSVDPFEGKPLSKEEDEFEDQLTDKMIFEKERKLKHLLATDPNYKDSEIVYTDQSWDDKTQRFKPGAPFLIKKESPTGEKTIIDYAIDKINEISVLNILAKYDKKKQQKLLKEANKIKQRKTEKSLNDFIIKMDDDILLKALANLDKKKQQESVKEANQIKKVKTAQQ